MQTKTTKTTKTTKKLRKAILRQILTTKGKIDRPALITKFQCSDRAFRNDINEIAQEIDCEQAGKMKVLRGICTDKLTIKAASDELDDATMAKIVTSGEVKKVEQTIGGTIQIDITKQINELIEVSEMPCNAISPPEES
jgi:hypothetical protein